MEARQVQGKLERLAPRIRDGARLADWRSMTGGSSALTLELKLRLADGNFESVVLRRYGERDLRQNPRVAECEFRLLGVAVRLDLPVPMPVLLGEPDNDWPTPFVVIERVNGKPDLAPPDLDDHLRRLAETLAAIHRVDPQVEGFGILPVQADSMAAVVRELSPDADGTLFLRRVSDALRAAWPFPSRNPPMLLHGDYWPGNVLWKDGDLAAVIDWEDAKIGDPLSDLANARLEVLWAFGWDAMRDFTRMYLDAARMDTAGLLYWDLFAALVIASNFEAIVEGWAPAPMPGRAADESELRERLRQFAEAALSRL